MTQSDHDSIQALVNRETGQSKFALIENAPCTGSCSRRWVSKRADPLSDPLESCGTVTVVEGRDVVPQLEKSWRGWKTCQRTSKSPDTQRSLDRPLGWGDQPRYR